MQRHKRYYTEPVEGNPDMSRIVMIWRTPKKRSHIRWCMYWAWHYQSDKQYIKKYFKNEE
jgi:hypothetical protein